MRPSLPSNPSMRPGQQRPGNHAVVAPLARRYLPFNEAGATTPRKLDLVKSQTPRIQTPSMRPGQQRPGNPLHLVQRRKALCPSMRPGQQRPGNRIRCRGITPPSSAFNEAGATTPRKRQVLYGRPKERRSFNEAGATTPRKQSAQGTDGSNQGAPSMRPGQQRPGNVERKGRRWEASQAFNEAGATTPRKHARKIRLAAVKVRLQ